MLCEMSQTEKDQGIGFHLYEIPRIVTSTGTESNQESSGPWRCQGWGHHLVSFGVHDEKGLDMDCRNGGTAITNVLDTSNLHTQNGSNDKYYILPQES
jgi:hypothetical protein